MVDMSSLSERMLADYDAKDPGTVFGEGLRLSIDEAKRLQSRVADLREQRGERVVGYKLGCVCEENQAANGITHPVWGRLWAGEQYLSGVRLKKSEFANVAIEGEFGVTLGRDIDPDHASVGEIADSIDFVTAVIELHNLVMRGDAPRAHELIANNAIHAGVVRGPYIESLQKGVSTDLAVLFDGEVVDSWVSLAWPDEILQATSWLVEEFAERGQRLRRGELLLTGAFGPPIPLGDRSLVEVRSSAFGSVEAAFLEG
jgi:2-keto-4-pentenoate hydratase